MAAADQMTSMEIPENLTEVMMGGSDEKENSPDRERAKRKLSLNSNSSGRRPNPNQSNSTDSQHLI